MKIDIQTIGFEADEKVMDLVNKRIQKLSDLENDMTGIDVYLKTIRDDQDQNKKVEMRAFLPGNDLFSEYQTDTFDEAIQQTYQKMKRQLVKRKEILQSR